MHVYRHKIVLIIEPVKNIRNNVRKNDFYNGSNIGVIKEGVLTEAGSIIRKRLR